jgi:hypothetical protein
MFGKKLLILNNMPWLFRSLQVSWQFVRDRTVQFTLTIQPLRITEHELKIALGVFVRHYVYIIVQHFIYCSYLYTKIRSQNTQKYQHRYPLFRTVRLRNSNIEKIKSKSTRYGQSVDDILTEILNVLDRGYSTPEDQRSW